MGHHTKLAFHLLFGDATCTWACLVAHRFALLHLPDHLVSPLCASSPNLLCLPCQSLGTLLTVAITIESLLESNKTVLLAWRAYDKSAGLLARSGIRVCMGEEGKP